jgi:nucleoid DNA-binding protein
VKKMKEVNINSCGKDEMCRYFKEITGETLGKPWDLATCDFVYDLIIEGIRRAVVDNGRVVLRGLCSFEVTRFPEREIYDGIHKCKRICPEHNIVKIKPTTDFKNTVAKLDVKFVNKLKNGKGE